MKGIKEKKGKPDTKSITEEKVDATNVSIETGQAGINGALLSEYKSEHVGICFTCNHKGTCLNLKRNVSGPIWFCENFDDSVEPGTDFQNDTVYPAYALLPEDKTRRELRLKGLCADCKNAAHCRLSRGIGGVWHCEEYL